MGNHLMLIYNKDLIPSPPKNTDELIEIGKKMTVDTDGDGMPDQYGLVWNFTEPFYYVPTPLLQANRRDKLGDPILCRLTAIANLPVPPPTSKTVSFSSTNSDNRFNTASSVRRGSSLKLVAKPAQKSPVRRVTSMTLIDCAWCAATLLIQVSMGDRLAPFAAVI